MIPIQTISIADHTTASSPNTHVIYIVKVILEDGQQYEVQRRYSQFVKLQGCLRDAYTLPPKHKLSTTVFPLAWIDDQLITERKFGLAAYLNHLINIPEFQTNTIFTQFLSSQTFDTTSFSEILDNPPAMISKDLVAIHNANGNPETNAAPISAAYYPTWSADTNPPHKIDFSKFDILFYAFVTPNASSTISWESGSQDTLRRLVASARLSGKGTKIVLSIGGWAGCQWFSRATSNATNRTKLTNALVGAVHSFGLDGVDIDWEYPNSPGAGNPFSSADSANLLALFKSLRTSLGPSKIISSAVAHMPWNGPNGTSLTDVRAFAAQMTYVNIMNYDVNGASSKPGPNAPLGNLCGSSSQPRASAQAALSQWTKAGMPASKLLLGLALYGYVSKSTAKKLSGSLMPDPSIHPVAHPRSPLQDISTAPAGDLSNMWGQQIAFKQLVRSGALVKTHDGYRGSNGYTMAWDDCSDTPYLYNVARTTVVSYDDTWSLSSKAKFAKKFGMAGCFTWSLDQDDGDTLQNVIRLNLGKR
ncbi:glycoside hydrolase family 18 protein [Collybia nuda]|uniref:Glycoside hydrolase family 18 protein n=1 Tax=Collybia nuda TaxID=64659 RepID=A0A9P6CDG0_9AGAR|nr:glycoside hydrolase family 18 protein [Collybia nuda]